jgi:uncharacterized membrane protein YccC
MSEQQGTLTTAIEDLRGTVADLKGDIAYTVQQLQNRNTELQTSLDTARTETGELRNLLAQEEIDDAAANAAIERLESALSDAQSNAATPEAITSLQGLTAVLQQVDTTLQQAPASPAEPQPTEPVPDTQPVPTNSTPGEPGTNVEPGENGGEVVPPSQP